jgi:hypothetical protein
MYCFIVIDYISKIAVALAVKEVNWLAIGNSLETFSAVICPYKTKVVHVGRHFPGNVFGNFPAAREIERHVVKAVYPGANWCFQGLIRTFQQILVKL